MHINDLDFNKNISQCDVEKFNRLANILCSVDKDFISDFERILTNTNELLKDFCFMTSNKCSGVSKYYRIIRVEDCYGGKIMCTAYEITYNDDSINTSTNKSVILDGDGVVRQFAIKQVLTNRVSYDTYIDKHNDFVNKYYKLNQCREEFHVKNVFNCDFCRNICKIKNCPTRCEPPVKCLGIYCDKKCDLFDKKASETIDKGIVFGTLKKLGNKIPKKKVED